MSIAVSPGLVDHPHRLKWNEKYARTDTTFASGSAVAQILSHLPPDGAALELAGGRSGTALALAELGRNVTVIDVSDTALRQLSEEAGRRGIAERLTLLHADLHQWAPDGANYAVVMCRFFWSATVFARACGAVRPGGILRWEAPALTDPPSTHVRAEWCLAPGEPASLLPDGFEVLQQFDRAQDGESVRSMFARRLPV
ncbi:Methyltransferase domain protein [Mycobacterium basiliense]|uniref:Methyltransferase domain protein n=1 Tax=Mycobacterium basiliense TaxID=2094119 RepID=A0A3S4C7U0_9MYCO|nr:class I SAM-dependent methyltransferase [Mycobacterium basiliense]VDM86567.1 Methyltransferase domain protein [Mycobacterium basiliense]